jgi:tripartite-type tricarboxylate transporter receptor subunit TctC
MVTYSVFDALEREGKLKIVAVATDKRLPNRPDLPTIGEAVPGYDINVWFGFAAPTGTPVSLLDKLHGDVTSVLKDREFVDRFVTPQAYIVGELSRQQFSDQIKAEYAKWGELVRISGVPIQ